MTLRRPGGVKYFAVVLSLLTCEFAMANGAIRARTPYEASDPFEVVYVSDKQDTKAKPGIYAVVRGKEDGELIIAGNVADANRNFPGIMSSFAMTHVTKRNESFAVVDGRLVIFANLTSKTDLKPKERGSLIFGKNVTVRDALTGLPIQLDLIKSTQESEISVLVDNINVQQPAQMFMISLNQPSKNGNGLTIVGALKIGTGGLELLGDPVVIDYTFQNASQLNRLRNQNTQLQVLSRLHLLQQAQPRASDDRILKKYRQFAQSVAAELKPGAKSNETNFSRVDPVTGQVIYPPYFDISKRELVTNILPVEAIPGSSIPITQRMDPFQGHSGLFFGPVIEDIGRSKVAAHVLGRVDYDAESRKYRVIDLRSAGGDSKRQVGLPDASDLNLLSIDQNIHALFFAGNKPATISIAQYLKPDFLKLKEKSGFKLTINEGANQIHYLFISMTKRTLVIKVMQTPDFTKIIDAGNLLTEYNSVKDLYARIRSVKEKDRQVLLFDRVSVKIKKPSAKVELAGEEQTQNPQDYVVYTNISENMQTGGKQVYLNAMQTVPLVGSTVQWRYYNPQGAEEEKTGIYLDPIADLAAATSLNAMHYTKFLPGTILTDADRPDNFQTAPKYRNKKKLPVFEKKSSPIVIAEEIDVEKSHIPELKMIFVPYVAPENRGKVAFNLAVYADQTASSHYRKVIPLLERLHVPVDFSRFLGLKLVQGRRKFSNTFSLMIFIAQKDAASAGFTPTRGGSGIYVMNLSLSAAPVGEFQKIALQPTSGDGFWLQMNQVNSAEHLKSRITYDTEGRPIWIETPELDRNNRGYQIRQLAKPADRPIFVNQGVGQVSVRWDEQFDDTWSLQYSKKSPWAVGFRSALETKILGLQKHLETLRTQEEERAKGKKTVAGRRNEILFPDLNEYLESMASVDGPKDHTVLLVEPTMYDTLRMLIASRLVEHGADKRHLWNLDNTKFEFHVYDPSFVLDETMRNLALTARDSNRDVLFVDFKAVLETEEREPALSFRADGSPLPAATPEAEAEQQNELADLDKSGSTTSKSGDRKVETSKTKTEDKGNERELKFPYARMAYIATEGDPVNLRRFEQAPAKKRIPTLILATPAMWRKYVNYFPEESKAGVFDQFKMDSRFLTGPWTVWSPKSAKASQETLAYQANTASKDEYLIFKNLDRILQSAASKDSPARHQLLIVPSEIKPLITRLIMTRWATDRADLDGKWSFRNRELALFLLTGAGITQEAIYDNYESMRGSLATRRPVLLADMSEVLKAGRVSTSANSTEYQLRDPLIAANLPKSLIAEITDVVDKNNPGSIHLSDAIREERRKFLATLGKEEAARAQRELELADANQVGSEEGSDTDTDSDSDSEAVERTQLPHMIWWLATEGKKVQPKAKKDWSIRAEVKPEIQTLIITTEKELETLNEDARFETRFLNLNDVFSVTKLERPSDQDKAYFLEELFRRPNISSLNYEFHHNKLPMDQARKQLIGLLIGQVEQIARQLKIEPTFAFLKIYSALNKALTEDVELRRSRLIDSPALFRLFAKVFPLPLTYEILRPDDPLQKMREPDRASRGLEEAGYNGPMELKTRHVRNMTQHTRATGDSSRKIPSSQVLIGEAGTGKTFLMEVTARYLGLKLYDFNKPHEEDAGAMFLRVMDLVEEADPSHPEKLDVKKAIEHMNNFLALPNGWRGMLVIDDLHKAGSTKILSQLMSFIQSIQEAPNGIYRARRMPGPGNSAEVKDIPVRNIMLTLTLNPIKDRAVRERFVEKFGKKDPAMEAVAALTRDGFSVEDSFFSRFGDIVDMSEFPREAKVPAILKNIREANAAEFATRPRVVMVSSETLGNLMDQFATANARDLIAPATFALLNLTSDLRKAPLYLVDPQTRSSGGSEDLENGKRSQWSNWSTESKKVEPGKIEEAMRSNTVVHAIQPDDPSSKLHLLSFIADNFRGMLYFAMILDAQNAPALTQNFESRTTNLFSFLAAVLGNIGEFRRLPIEQMAIKPAELGARGLDHITLLQTNIKKHPSNAKMPKIRIPVGINLGDQVSLASFLGNKEKELPERRRMDMMVETTADIQKVLETLLARVYHVGALNELVRPIDWINGLDESEPKKAFKDATDQLFRIYLSFMRNLYDVNLEETRNQEGLLQMQSYDEARLFLLCLDRALTQMPWSHLTQFTLEAVDLAANDLAVGQKIGLQHFLFKSSFSPLATVTPESIVANTRSISALKNLTSEREQKYHSRFTNNCDKFLRISE